MNIDERILEYFDELVAFNPDTATDAQRTALLEKGLDLIGAKTEKKPETMKDIVDKHAAGVDTGSINVPDYLVSDIEKARTQVRTMIETRKATVEAYRQGAKTIFTTLIKVAAIAAVP